MNAIYYPLHDLNRRMLQFTMLVSLFLLLSFNPVTAVELKPIATTAAQSSAASAPTGQTPSQQNAKGQPGAWEKKISDDDAEETWEQKLSDDSSRVDEDRMAREIAKSVVDQVMDNMHRGNPPSFFNGSTVSLALLIPILAITFVIGGPIFIVIYLIRARYQAKQKRLEMINTNIDKLIAAGRDIPPELLRVETSTNNNYDEMLHSGIKNLFVGIGLFLFLTIFMGIWIGSVGFIVMAVGLSQLAIWKLSAPKPGAVQPTAQSAAEKSSSDNLF